MENKKIKSSEKEDIKFKIQFDQSNRNFLTTLALFYLNAGIALTAVIISIVTFIFSINRSSDRYIILVILILLALFLIYLWIWHYKEAKKNSGNARKVNKQLQERLFKIYPEYKNEYH